MRLRCLPRLRPPESVRLVVAVAAEGDAVVGLLLSCVHIDEISSGGGASRLLLRAPSRGVRGLHKFLGTGSKATIVGGATK